ncbi:histidine kinase [Mesobacillus subterraneus]|uniref:sensor histidine kinase n=1 Tax=Mesobacillus subterraneus TaxID=285983 RepID=UPI00203AB787|nr:sensor histidine kinase [Mesobacillus subterraneus]MCM3665814.1 histidine kinase [Mesobacillus subterraneus]MCM3684795.1 histidine kinase [Mesobacillus subterraneus]
MGKKFFIRHFATRVVLTMLVVILIPTIFISVFFYISSSEVIKKNVRESSIQITKQAADSISHIFSTGKDLSDIMYGNEQLQQAVKKDLDPDLNNLDRNRNNEYITQMLNLNTLSSSFVKRIYIIKEDGMSWGSGTFSMYKLSKYDLDHLSWKGESLKKDGAIIWNGLEYDRFSGAGENIQLILPTTRVMKDFNNLQNIAFIQVYLDGESILNKISQIQLGKTGHFFIIDEKGNVMVDDDIEKINKPVQNRSLFQKLVQDETMEFEYELEGKKYYGVKQDLNNGWKIVGVVPINEITGELNKFKNITLFYSIFFTMIAIIIGWALAKRVTQPVNTLTEQMKLAGEGNFNVRANVQSSDEIGIMSLQFNRMINQIDHLMDQVTTEQKEKKEAELRAVRHRINPHFLFNTLSTIRWLTKFNQLEKANTAFTALIRLLEANMGKKGTFVTLDEELDIIQKFIDIMEIRYDQEFRLKLNVHDDVRKFPIPQMLLQPIVENAIFHGIVPTGKEGVIWISGISIDDGVEIRIRNNGIPIKEEQLKQIKSQENNSYIGIGLKHVFDSVRLYFSNDSIVNINIFGEGTEITLILKQKLRG